MKIKIKALAPFVVLGALLSSSVLAHADEAWKTTLKKEIPLLGHRNWIVIADSAYPAQSRAGIATVVTGASQIEVVKTVLAELAKTKHVRPTIFTDKELPYVSEKDAPGITLYRKQLANALGKRPVQATPHEKIIYDLDDAGKTFRILILKTNLTLPYTSVFLQLGAGYWNDASEKRLRDAIAKK